MNSRTGGTAQTHQAHSLTALQRHWQQRLAVPRRHDITPFGLLTAADIDALNFVGDPLADRVIRAIDEYGSAGGGDIAALRELRAQGNDAAEAFWSAVTDVPSFIEFDRMRPIAGFNRRNFFAGPFFVAGALPFTYSDPNVAAVLDFGGGLRRGGDQIKRFRETVRGVMSVNDVDELHPGGKAWEGWVRVRLLHARVRSAIVGSGAWDYGVGSPVSALRIAGGSYVFATFIPQVYLSMGATASAAEIEAIAHVWQWVTYLLGAPLDLIPTSIAEQHTLDAELLDRTILSQSNPAGARLAREWFECCARQGVLGLRMPVWFIEALARRAIKSGLKHQPALCSQVLNVLQIRHHRLAEGLVSLFAALVFLVGQGCRLPGARKYYETLGDEFTARLITRLGPR